MTPETQFFIEQARECLRRAHVIHAAGIGEDAGRNAYMAAFHAAQALVFERLGRVAKTDRGIRTLISGFAKGQPELREFSQFLTQSYDLKQTVDYPFGSDARVSPGEAEAAIQKAEQFVDYNSSITSSGCSNSRAHCCGYRELSYIQNVG